MAEEVKKEDEKEKLDMSWIIAFMTYNAYACAVLIGHFKDFVAMMCGYNIAKKRKGYALLLNDWENFYTRRLYGRLNDCWNRPICSSPGANIEVMERTHDRCSGTTHRTGTTKKCLNLGSYNYLGFADDWKETCREDVIKSIDKWPISLTGSRTQFGTGSIHRELEETVARFVGKESAIIFPMGFSTNATTIPALMGEGALIVSDSLNHTSIVNGARASPSMIRVFRHNEADHLEEILREAIVIGQPRHRRPWKKILVMVEGIYSMEGNICNLPAIVAICKKYKAFLYVDEAHSIGALGKTGRGICEHSGINPDDIDILMGTFTKSFSGMGGYIASSKEVTDFVRAQSAGVLHHNSMSPIVCQQVLTAFKVIMGEDGTNVGRQKLDALISNSNKFRSKLIDMGLHVYGDFDSPIIPIVMYQPAKIAAFSRECLDRGLAVVVVGFPATSPLYTRARFCISAAHTEEEINFAIDIIEEVTTILCMKYSKNIIGWA